MILNVLLRLQVDVSSYKKLNILKLLYSYLINLCTNDVATRAIIILSKQTSIYHITLVEITNDLKQKLKIAYVKNHY